MLREYPDDEQAPIGSVIGAALVDPRVIKDRIEHIIESDEVYGDFESLGVSDELSTLLGNNFLPAFRHYEDINDLKRPDRWHDRLGAFNDGLQSGFCISCALIFEKPSC